MKLPYHLVVSMANQQLSVFEGDHKLLKQFPISTAKKGAGEQMNSEQTPRGWHVIYEKIGKEAPLNTVFVNRQPTGEIYTSVLGKKFPKRDWILTRILWLNGLEIGKNLKGAVDTLGRYIYIHGAPDEVAMGIPASRGCIRMHNANLLELFDLVSVGTRVLITEE